MASYSIVGYTDTTVTITVTGLVVGSSSYRFIVRLTDDVDDRTITTSFVTATSSTVTQTFSGLSPSTSYTANINVDNSWLGSTTFTTRSEETSINVEPWDWSDSSERINFYNVLYGNLPANPEYFSRNVWNDLVNKVNELMIATNATTYGWNEVYATLSDTYVNSGENLSAVKFNSLRNNLHFVRNTGINKVNVGDPILPSYFITITETINSVIENT